MKRIELVEAETTDFASAALSEDEAVALERSGVATVEFPSPLNGRHYRVRPEALIGHIPVSDTLIVSIQPKARIDSVFGMLETVYDLRSFRFNEGIVDLATVEDYFERFAHVLARRVLLRVRAGLYREYVTVEEPLSCVRGRMDAVRTAIACARAAPAVHCRYDEISADIEDNAILLWTLHCVLRGPVRREEVRRDLRAAYRALIGCVSLRPIAAERCGGRQYHRLNEDYRVLHGLCELLLAGLGPRIDAGTRRLLPFQLNMATLFERYLGTWLAARLPRAFAVQARKRWTLEASDQFTLIADVLVSDRHDGRNVCVIDAKYKLSERPSQADLNQVVVYAAELGVRHALIAYPVKLPSPFSAKVRDVNIEVHAVGFDLGCDLRTAGEDFIRQIVANVPRIGESV